MAAAIVLLVNNTIERVLEDGLTNVAIGGTLALAILGVELAVQNRDPLIARVQPLVARAQFLANSVDGAVTTAGAITLALIGAVVVSVARSAGNLAVTVANAIRRGGETSITLAENLERYIATEEEPI